MAHKKGGGAVGNSDDSAGRRLGIKKSGGQRVVPGNIICRQRGTKWYPGDNVGIGRDYTIFATKAGVVVFARRGRKGKVFISVAAEE